MEMTSRGVCPVCGARGEDRTGVACPVCSFAYAFVPWFAGEDGRMLWEKKAEEARNLAAQKAKAEAADASRAERAADAGICELSVRRDRVAFLSGRDHTLRILYGDGRSPLEREDVAQYAVSETGEYILYRDGRVEARGDDSFGQCNTTGLGGILCVAPTGSGVFYADREGRILARGFVEERLLEETKRWRGVCRVAAGEKLVLGLTKEGNVLVASLLPEEIGKKIKGTDHVKDIRVFRDSCLMLLKDGRVRFGGRPGDDRAEAETWRDVASVSLDGTYAVGLKETGEVVLAGRAKNRLLDAGRKNAAAWTGMCAVASSSFAIAGLDREGRVHIAGSFSGDIDAINERWERER